MPNNKQEVITAEVEAMDHSKKESLATESQEPKNLKKKSSIKKTQTIFNSKTLLNRQLKLASIEQMENIVQIISDCIDVRKKERDEEEDLRKQQQKDALELAILARERGIPLDVLINTLSKH